MKLPLLALLCAATAAFCQSSPAPSPIPSQLDSGRLFQMPQKFMPQASAFTPPLASLSTLATPAPYSTLIAPGPTTPRKLNNPRNNPQIDPKIIVRPPWPSGEDQMKGQDLSRNQFPNLRYLPIRVGAAKTTALHDGASQPGRSTIDDRVPR